MSKEHGNPRKQAMPRILISKLLVTDGLAGSHPQLLSHHNTWNFYNDYRETSTCIYVIHIISEAKHFALHQGDLLFYAFTHVECTRDAAHIQNEQTKVSCRSRSNMFLLCGYRVV
jgi:hypothetical protein